MHQLADLGRENQRLQQQLVGVQQQQQQQQPRQQSSSSSSTAQPQPLVDARLLAKPSQCCGTQTPWADWSFSFESYVKAVTPQTHAHMIRAVAEDTPIDDTKVTSDACSLFYVLVMSAKGKALRKLRSAPEGKAWMLGG